MTDRLQEIRARLYAATSSHYAHERFEAQEEMRSHAEDDIAWLLAVVQELAQINSRLLARVQRLGDS